MIIITWANHVKNEEQDKYCVLLSTFWKLLGKAEPTCFCSPCKKFVFSKKLGSDMIVKDFSDVVPRIMVLEAKG